MPAGADGSIALYASNTTDAVVDINGYFVSEGTPGGLAFYPVTPCRVADTRGNGFTGSFGQPTMTGGSSRSFPIQQSTCGIPATAQAYALNMTAVPSNGGPLYYLTAWPTGQPQPYVSTLDSWTGDVVANAAIVPAGSNGAVDVFVTNDTDVLIDINGYFAPPGATGALSYYPVTPCRISRSTHAATASVDCWGHPVLLPEPAATSRSSQAPAASRQPRRLTHST